MKISKSSPIQWHSHIRASLNAIDRLFIKQNNNIPNFNRRMFEEDFAKLPQITNKKGATIITVTCNDNTLLAQLLTDNKSRRLKDINTLISNQLDDISKSLVTHGKAYKFVETYGNRVDINIVPLSPIGIIRILKKHFQWIPVHIEKTWDAEDKLHPREIRILPSERIMSFSMPASLKHKLSSQRKTLKVIDKHQYSEINLIPKPTHENPNPKCHFDFNAWKKFEEDALYRSSKESGWDCRNYNSINCSDFFTCYRMLKFLRNKMLLRDHLLMQISQEFTKIGRLYNPEFTTEIFVSKQEFQTIYLDRLEDSLTHEEVGFQKIINYCHGVMYLDYEKLN